MIDLAVGVSAFLFAASAWISIRYGRVGPGVMVHFMVALVATLFPLQIAMIVAAWWGWRVWIGAPLDGLSSIGLALSGVGGVALAAFLLSQFRLRTVIADSLREAGVATRPPTRLSPARLFRPMSFRRVTVERIRDTPYGPAGIRNVLDIYRPVDAMRRPTRLPVLLQVHGSAWMVSNKNMHALPLLHHMAHEGWLVASINYRLSPAARFPAHLVDVKLAIAWLREHVHEYGGDPDFIALTGGSAGAHLAALAALTPGRPETQPGFETADTRVAAVVPIYGRYDFLDRDGANPHHAAFVRLLTRYIMPGSPDAVPDLWELASPIAQVRADAPPFFVVHGTHDSIIPVEIARAFVARLRSVSHAAVAYAELPGIQHGFDAVHSPATHLLVQAAQDFLEAQWKAHSKNRGFHDARQSYPA